MCLIITVTTWFYVWPDLAKGALFVHIVVTQIFISIRWLHQYSNSTHVYYCQQLISMLFLWLIFSDLSDIQEHSGALHLALLAVVEKPVKLPHNCLVGLHLLCSKFCLLCFLALFQFSTDFMLPHNQLCYCNRDNI